MMDSLFQSPGAFRTEIVWKRSSAHSDTKQGRRQHGRIHDVILFYTNGEDWTWNPIYTPYDPSTSRRSISTSSRKPRGDIVSAI
jgi:hypothetical protein